MSRFFGYLTFVVITGMASSTQMAFASTSESWDELYKRVNQACIDKSGLVRPEIIDAKISFSDVVPIEARFLRGADDKGKAKRLICVFDRKTGHAEVQEAPEWNAPALVQ